MAYLLYISIDNLYSQTLGGDLPLLIHKDKRVLDRNEPAAALGVFRGMPLSEGRSILGGAGKIVQWEEEPFREAQDRWLQVCASFTDVIEPVEQHTAILDLSGHPKPDDLVERLASEIQTTCDMSARTGAGRCRWIAQLACFYGDKDKEALSAPRDFIASCPTGRMLSVSVPNRVRLKFLGYARVGDVADVPLPILKKHFQAEAVDIYRAAMGNGDHHVRALYPEASIHRRWSFPSPPDTEDQLEYGFDRISSGLAKELIKQERIARHVDLFIEHESCAVTKLNRSFSKPITSRKELKTALRLMLPENAAAKILGGSDEERIIGLRVRLPRLETPGYVQLELKGAKSPQERKLSADLALRCVSTVFGDKAVQTASQVAPSRRQQVMGAWKDARGWY